MDTGWPSGRPGENPLAGRTAATGENDGRWDDRDMLATVAGGRGEKVQTGLNCLERMVVLVVIQTRGSMRPLTVSGVRTVKDVSGADGQCRDEAQQHGRYRDPLFIATCRHRSGVP